MLILTLKTGTLVRQRMRSQRKIRHLEDSETGRSLIWKWKLRGKGELLWKKMVYGRREIGFLRELTNFGASC